MDSCRGARGDQDCVSSGRCPTTTSICSRTGAWRSDWHSRGPRPRRRCRRAVDGSSAQPSRWRSCGRRCLSPDYIDGRFFRVTLLTDERFADASLVFGGLSRDQMAENRAFLEPLPEGAELLEPPAFVEPPRLRAFAAVATWGGLALEAMVALLCLIPRRSFAEAERIQLARHASLLVFCVTTYALAPVAGFGWLLGDDGPRPMPSGSADVARRLRRGVRPHPFVFRDSLGRGPGGLDGCLNGLSRRQSASNCPSC